MSALSNATGRLISQLVEADPDMIDIVQQFVAELPGRLGKLRDALHSGDWDRLVVLAHQLKGAGGSYGYPDISEVARQIEADARARAGRPAEKRLQKLERLCAAAAAALNDT